MRHRREVAALSIVYSLIIGVNAQGGGGTTNALSLCSNDNTGSSSGSHFDIYNSYGSCTSHCSGYSFAIMQGKNCWCSNYAPGSSVSVGQCSDSCPGYDTDKCGNADQGLFGYAQIAEASGTVGASSSSVSSTHTTSVSSTSIPTTTTSSSTTSSSTTSTTTSISSSTSTLMSTSTLVSSTSISTTSSSSTSALSSSSSSGPTSSSAETTSRETSTSGPATVFITRGGSDGTSSFSVETVFPSSTSHSPVSSTSSSSAASFTGSSANYSKQHKGFWNNTSAVGGVFAVVGIVGLALLCLVAFFIWRYCRNKRNSNNIIGADGSDPNNGASSGKHAYKTFAGVGGESETSHQHASAASPQSLGHVRNSSSAFSDSDMKLVPIFDQRVDPNQLYMRWDQNASATSLQDNEDYSRRVLRVANPNEDNESLEDAERR